MKKITLFVLCVTFSIQALSQARPINKLTLETTYSYIQISKTLRDLIDQADKSSYFDDNFFNDKLQKIVSDRLFSEKEKAQLFYLMYKKLGFAFVGVNYMPPKQNYYQFFMGEVQTGYKTKASLKSLNYNTSELLALVDSNWQLDAVLAGNALLLATFLNPDSARHAIEHYSQGELIMKSKNPDIFNHYVCLSAGIKQSPVIVDNLSKNLMSFRQEALIEDALCAFHAQNNLFSVIKEYILREDNPQNDLAIQTAICVLHVKVPPATFEKSLKELISETKDKWKKDLLKDLLARKIPYFYTLADKEEVVTKKWEGVVLSFYTDGALMTNGSLLEFDPN